ncbi:hypothetical protein F5Y19DRAFT_233263 [Xylariaceae sp. FL1651]|nr:hypothetical protein F5Y19DRAFT_233263 [Xylariaceae sp. FL1651]
MSNRDGKEYKPYTTPYTGAGSVRTEQGWVNSRDLGAPGATSGPGKRRGSAPPIPPFHHAEVTSTTVAPPPGHENTDTGNRSGRGSISSGSRASRSRSGSINLQANNQDINEIKGPRGIGFDLPRHHPNVSKLSNREIALKIGLLNIKKGSIHETLHQAATNRDILSRDPQQQFQLRNETSRQLSEVEEAIRAWESIQMSRAENIPNPGLVDMLMISQDYHEKEEPKDQDPTPANGSSSSGLGLDGKKKEETRY